MDATYTYQTATETLKVVIEAGKVTHSDAPCCVVGEKPNLDCLRRCGWKKVTRATLTDVWGRKIS
jgi:hypothetical protein